MLSIIVAIANNNVIGKDNKLIWYLPEDLKRFKQITTGKTIIMGRKTFESLGRVLPNRKHIVLTRNKEGLLEDKNVEYVTSLQQLQKYITSEEENIVIGGGVMYELLLPYTNKLYITKIDHNFDGDTFFPKIDYTKWELIEEIEGIKDEKNIYNYKYLTYIRENYEKNLK